MLEGHKALRREFRLAPTAVRRTAGGDRRQARRVAVHLQFMIGVLHHHHAGEDRLLWPRLYERVPEQLAPTVSVMEAQHEAISALLDDVDPQLQRWAAHPEPSSGERLAETLTRLSEALDEHLAAEERDVLPLAEAHLTAAEWQLLERDGIDNLPKSQAPVLFGALMYEGDPEVISLILGRAPLPVRILMPHLGPRAYAHRARRVHGTPTP
jgi:hemerythrin-like domain-containing protein